MFTQSLGKYIVLTCRVLLTIFVFLHEKDNKFQVSLFISGSSIFTWKNVSASIEYKGRITFYYTPTQTR